MAYVFNLLNGNYKDYGIPDGRDVLEPADDEAKAAIRAAWYTDRFPLTKEEAQERARRLAGLARVGIVKGIRNHNDYEVGGYEGHVLLGCVPTVSANAHGENPMLLTALATELRKLRLCPVFAVFENKGGGEVGEFRGFADAV